MNATLITYDADDVSVDLPPDATFETWSLAGLMLAKRHSGLHWLIGDWVGYGAERWADRWLQVASTIGIPHPTLAQAAAVASTFPPERRNASLSWSHHRAAANTDEPDEWLARAAEAGWSARQLEEAIRDAKALEPPSDELDGMPPKPLFDRGEAARLLAQGVTRVIVDLTPGEMSAAA